MFGKEIYRSILERKVIAGEKSSASFSIDSIPWYKGKFDVEISIKHQASFLFESDAITEDMKKE